MRFEWMYSDEISKCTCSTDILYCTVDAGENSLVKTSVN
jgi:hypothetical protein